MEVQRIRIEKLVSGGHGLGHLDGRVVLAPYGAPGDEVLLDGVESRRGVSWGNIKEILSSSPSRVSPFCPHYTQCGGCQLQHISYRDQLEYKRLILLDALTRLGGLKDVDVGTCIGSPVDKGYRSRVRLHCQRSEIGFHKSRSNMIHPVDYCPVLSDKINTCLRQFSSYLCEHPIRGLSEIQMVEDTDSRVILMLEMDALPEAGVINGLREALKGERRKEQGSEEGKGERAKAKGEEAAKEIERLLQAGSGDQNNRGRESVGVSGAVVRVGNQTRHLWGEIYSTVSVEGRTFRVSPGSFFQANVNLLPILLQQTLSAVKADEIDTGVELYAGVGLFSIMLSERVRRLVAVEWNRDAVEDAGVNLHTNQIKNVEVIAKSAEDALDLLLSRDAKPGLVVMDPPREGLSNAVRHKILQMSPEQLIYISCNPATLARDIKSLLASGGYVLEKVQPLDMFPHTSHIECICSLARKRGGTRMARGSAKCLK